MSEILTKELREELLGKLSQEQADFVRNHVKRGKKTIFANVMAKDKGIILPADTGSEEVEHLLEEWVLVDYIDHGFVNPETPCECGRSLRYQYIVKHMNSGEIRSFGINHFQEHTGLPSEVVKQINQGFQTIDYEMDEVLAKIANEWNLKEELPIIREDYRFPADMQKHLDANIPLLDRQMQRLKQHVLLLSNAENFDQKKDHQTFKNDIPTFEKQFREPEPIDLFSETEMPKPKKEADLLPYALADEYRQAVKKYLMEGVTSARIISELLIKNNHAPVERFYSERPKVYVPVCFYLDLLVSKGEAIHIGSLNLDDRYYRLQSTR